MLVKLHLLRFIAVLFCTVVLCTRVDAQVNLVPNPSFEDTVFCPWGTNQFEACDVWQNFGNSPDYFNSCSPTVNVPNCTFGFQYSHTGNAHAGLALYVVPTGPNGPNYREFIGIELIQPLLINEKYYFSFYTNYSYTPNIAIAANKIGFRFSTVPFDSCCPPPTNNFAQLYSPTIITDSINWTRLSGSFFADSAYRYIMIGNFFDDAHTDTLNLSALPNGAYYYIDDVCVTSDSLYNNNWTIISLVNPDASIRIIHNIDNIIINSESENIISVELFSLLGQRELFFDSIYSTSVSVPIAQLLTGIHIFKINFDGFSLIRKISLR